MNLHEALRARVAALEGPEKPTGAFGYLLGLINGFGETLLTIPDPFTGAAPDPVLESVSNHLASLNDTALEYFLQGDVPDSSLLLRENNATVE